MPATHATTRATAFGSRSAPPPLGGIALYPSVACLTSISNPCAIRAFHAVLSPSLGAPAAPEPWQAMHRPEYTACPSRSVRPAAPLAAANSSLATGARRAATASGDIGPVDAVLDGT